MKPSTWIVELLPVENGSGDFYFDIPLDAVAGLNWKMGDQLEIRLSDDEVILAKK